MVGKLSFLFEVNASVPVGGEWGPRVAWRTPGKFMKLSNGLLLMWDASPLKYNFRKVCWNLNAVEIENETFQSIIINIINNNNTGIYCLRLTKYVQAHIT